MGLRFRKSIGLGKGTKATVSKSGVRLSWGIPGFRITRTSKGKIRKTFSIPGTGISYVDEGSSKKDSKKSDKKESSSLFDIFK